MYCTNSKSKGAKGLSAKSKPYQDTLCRSQSSQRKQNYRFPEVSIAKGFTKTFDVESPNVFHQADLLFLPHDRLPRGRKVYKHAWTVLDVTSWYKDVEPLIPKDAHAPDRLY